MLKQACAALLATGGAARAEAVLPPPPAFPWCVERMAELKLELATELTRLDEIGLRLAKIEKSLGEILQAKDCGKSQAVNFKTATESIRPPKRHYRHRRHRR
jgi:hypothetical protein